MSVLDNNSLSSNQDTNLFFDANALRKLKRPYFSQEKHSKDLPPKKKRTKHLLGSFIRREACLNKV